MTATILDVVRDERPIALAIGDDNGRLRIVQAGVWGDWPGELSSEENDRAMWLLAEARRREEGRV